MADVIERAREEIAGRLVELKPRVEEYEQLAKALAVLDSVASASPVTPTAASGSQPAVRRAPRRRARKASGARRGAAAPSSRGGAAARPGRRKGSGKRTGEALSLIEKHPGATIAELAARMGIKPNYLYRVLPGLAEEGKIVKDGGGWKPV